MTSIDDTAWLEGRSLCRARPGEDQSLELVAAAWLAKSRIGVTALRDKHDYLTKDQLQNRYDKEVYTSVAVPDESLMSGLFKRDYNPLAGSRPSKRNSMGDD